MAFVKRTWKDRISEFPNRRTINDGNVTKQVTVGRDEGNITEEGDSFDASNMNDLEQRIEDAYGDVQGLVASEVAQQYDSANVIFDAEPTEGHGTGYTVTSEGIKTAIDSGLVHTKTASGSLVHIEDGADNIPVKSLVSQIVAVETGNGQPKSPDNPYTISGFDSGVVSVCGVNLWNETTKNGYWNTTNGNYVSVAGQLCSNDYIPVKENKAYYFYKGSTTNQSEVLFYDKSKTFIGYLNYSQCVNKAFTTPSNCAYITFNLGSNYGTTYLNNISFNYPSSDTQYHAYNGNTYTFTFGQNVYGGHFDNKGNLVVTHGIISDLGSLAWGGSDGQFNYNFNVIPKSWTRNNENWGKCSALKVESWSTIDYGTQSDNSIHGLAFNTIFILRVYASDYSTADELKTALSGQSLVYELANPITLSITSQDIPTLWGETNIFSNTGDVEVTYYVDTEAIYAIRDVIDEFAMQSDWNEADNTKADYIKNKPTIPANADFSLSGLSDTDISSPSVGQVLTFDGDNWVNNNQIVVKYEEINVTFDANGEGTLFNSVKFVVGLKDIPSDQLYVGYVSYIAGSVIKIKALSRTAIAFSSQNNVSSTRKVGVYYLDNITTQ